MAQGFNQGGASKESGQSPGFSTSTGEGSTRALGIQAEAMKDSNTAFLKALDSTIKFADQQFAKSAEEEAKAGVDVVQEDTRRAFFERELQTQAVGAMPEETPKEIADKEREMARIKAAYDNGSLSSTHYWSRLDATARSLRARYPGYTEEIDAAVSKYSGGKPANQVIGDILSQVQAESKKQAKDEIFELMKEFKHVPAVAGAIARGERPTKMQLLQMGSAWEAGESIRKRASAEFSMKSEAWGLQSRMEDKDLKERTRDLTSLVNLETTGEMEKLFAPLDPAITALNKAASEGRGVDEKVLQDLAQRAPAIEAAAIKAIDRNLSRKRENGLTLFEMVKDQAEIDRIRNAQIERIKLVTEAYKSGDGRILNTLKMYNELSAQGGEAHVRSSDFINKFAALSKFIPQADLSLTIGSEGALRKEWEAVINTKLKVVNGGSKDTLGSLITDIKNKGGTGDIQAQAIDDVFKSFVNDKLTPDRKENFFNFLFGDSGAPGSDIMTKLRPGTQREEFFAKMTSVKGIEAIKKLEEAKPGTIEKYKQWVEHNGAVHMMQIVNTATMKNEQGGSHTIVYSKEDQRFKAVPNPKFKRDINLTVPVEGDAGTRAIVTSANKAIASMTPAFQVIYPKKDLTNQLWNFIYDKAGFKLLDTPKE